MENLFELLILALFLLPFLGRGKKKKKQQEKQRQKERRRKKASRGQRAERRTPVPAGGGAPGGSDASMPAAAESGGGESTGAPDDPAADMLPDDLWEVLTGEQRPDASQPAPGASVPEGAEGTAAGRSAGSGPRDAPDFGSRSEPAPYEWSERRGERARRRAEDDEAVSLETIPEPDYPQVVSLEQPPPAPDVRHARFHREMKARKRRDAARRRKRRKRRVDLGLGSRDELRRAVVLREVLGPPKGLEF